MFHVYGFSCIILDKTVEINKITGTTRFRCFAECTKHSQSPYGTWQNYFSGKVNTAKYVMVNKALPSTIFRALGESFAKCQKALGKIK